MRPFFPRLTFSLQPRPLPLPLSPLLPPLFNHPLNLPPKHPPHFPRHPLALVLIQLVPLPAPKHRPAAAFDLGSAGRARDDVEVDVGDDLGGAGAVVLHDVVVGYVGDGGDGAGEEGEEEAWVGWVRREGEGEGEWRIEREGRKEGGREKERERGRGARLNEDEPISLLSPGSMSATLTLWLRVATRRWPVMEVRD